jgi:hypothetical protein
LAGWLQVTDADLDSSDEGEDAPPAQQKPEQPGQQGGVGQQGAAAGQGQDEAEEQQLAAALMAAGLGPSSGDKAAT